MSMNLSELKKVMEEARPRLQGRKVLGFRDGGPDTYLLLLTAPEDEYPKLLRLLICIRDGLVRAHLTPRQAPRKSRIKTTAFAARVNDALEGMAFHSLDLPREDRVLELGFKDEEGRFLGLTAELTGRHANLVLMNREGLILSLARRFHGKTRILQTNEIYSALPLPEKKPPRSRSLPYDGDGDEAWTAAPLNGAADRHYLEQEQNLARTLLQQRLKRKTGRTLKRLRARLEKIEAQLVETGETDRIRKMADLLQASFHRIRKGSTEIEVEDLFSPEGGTITIPLNPAKDPQANIAALYKRAGKLKSSIPHLHREKEEAHKSMLSMDGMVKEIHGAGENLEALEALAAQLGILEPQARPVQKAPKKRPVFDGRSFLSSDGLPIYVGKDGTANHRLTFRFARGNDMWFHCRDVAGSHVLIRGERNKSIPLDSLIDAGLLAVHFSKRRGAREAEVMYTAKKHVRPLKGAGPGKVLVDRHKTLNIRSDPDRLKEILNRPGPSHAQPR